MSDELFWFCAATLCFIAGGIGYLFRKHYNHGLRRLAISVLMLVPVVICIFANIWPHDVWHPGDHLTRNEGIALMSLALFPAWAFGLLTGYMVKSQASLLSHPL